MSEFFASPELGKLTFRWLGSLTLSLAKITLPYANAGMRDQKAAIARTAYVCARAVVLHMEKMAPELSNPMYQRAASSLAMRLDEAFAAAQVRDRITP